MVCDHFGTPLWWSGPHIGSRNDGRIYKENPPPLEDGEMLAGDAGYQGQPQLVTPYKKHPGEVNRICKTTIGIVALSQTYQ